MAGLVDIEELAERVRSASARSFIKEAVTCYKAGAYRSCVVATWIALIYDFVDKFRELALSGDTSAKKLVAEFDRVQKERDTAAALKFEREVLDIAKDDYELLSPQEYVDLKRLAEDRNRYGHPNINQDAEALGATPEMARAHLRSAVEHVMERPPVQGKVALQAIRLAVDSPYFPRNVDDAVASLSATPLTRAKRVLIRDFFLGCIISLVREKPPAEAFERRSAATLACRRMHPQVVEEVIADKLQDVFDKTDDDCLGYLIVVLARIPDLQGRVSAALKVRLKSFVNQLSELTLSILNFAADLDFLKVEVATRLKSVTAIQLQTFVQGSARAPARLVIDRAIEMLETSRSWDSSNAISSAISERMLDRIDSADALRILMSGVNGEVKWSFNYPVLVGKLFEHKLLTLNQVSDFAESEGVSSLDSLLEKLDPTQVD